MPTPANHGANGVPARALVLFAHGSRDPLWHRPIQAVAQAIARQSPGARVACAYLELSQPELPQVTSELAAEGIKHITVVPMFLGVGKHVRHDLPQMMTELVQQYPEVTFECQSAVGEHPDLLDLLARIAVA